MKEFEIIDLINQKFPIRDKYITGIGDDCAIIPQKNGICQLISTDLLLEKKHFYFDRISAMDLGYKAVAVNISDILAMGAIPKYLLLSLGIPPKVDSTYLNSFLSGIKSLQTEIDFEIIGGDTSSSTDFNISITVIGEQKKDIIKTRDLAQKGDFIIVNGHLGNSAGGFYIIDHELDKHKYSSLVDDHHKPKLNLESSIWLASQRGVHAMMDMSDGLSSDLRKILVASKVGAEILQAQIPMSPNLLNFCRDSNLDPYQFSLHGGEDYKLLLTIDKDEIDRIEYDYQLKFDHSLFRIGRITEAPSNIILHNNNSNELLIASGFKHFS